MKKIKNKSFTAAVISLQEGRTITLPARSSADISDEDFESPEIQRLFEERSIIVLPEGVELPKTEAAAARQPEAVAAPEPKRKGRGPQS